MESTVVEVKHLQRGQPRPYAPHTYAAEITVKGEYAITMENARDLVKALVHPFTDEPVKAADMHSYFKARLVQFECRQERFIRRNFPRRVKQVWFAQVEIPFCD